MKNVIYVDDRNLFGQEALEMLKSIPVLVISISGGLPFTVRGRRRYDFDEIKLLVAECLAEGHTHEEQSSSLHLGQ